MSQSEIQNPKSKIASWTLPDLGTWGDVRWAPTDSALPVVVFLHGFKGFKDWGPFPAWGEHLARAGFVVYHVNFAFNGMSREAPMEQSETERFAENTISREVDETLAVLDAVAEGLGGAPVDAARIGLVGHSRGGGVAILAASESAHVRALATWASVADFLSRITPEQRDEWREKGRTHVLNGRTGVMLPMDRTYLEDLESNAERLDVTAAASRLDVPWLVVHAKDDPAVAFSDAETLREANPRAQLVEAAGGHTFAGAHPFEGDVPEDLAHVWDETTRFLQEHLQGVPARR